MSSPISSQSNAVALPLEMQTVARVIHSSDTHHTDAIAYKIAPDWHFSSYQSCILFRIHDSYTSRIIEHMKEEYGQGSKSLMRYQCQQIGEKYDQTGTGTGTAVFSSGSLTVIDLPALYEYRAIKLEKVNTSKEQKNAGLFIHPKAWEIVKSTFLQLAAIHPKVLNQVIRSVPEVLCKIVHDYADELPAKA